MYQLLLEIYSDTYDIFYDHRPSKDHSAGALRERPSVQLVEPRGFVAPNSLNYGSTFMV